MEEREKIIKKTAELVLKDAKEFSFPIFRKLKLYWLGVFSGASVIFLNGIGTKISRNFKENLPQDSSWRDRDIINIGQITGILGLIGFLIFKSVTGNFWWVIKLLVISNLIGIGGVTYNYLSNKKTEAIKLISVKEDKIDEKIKIEKPRLLNEAINR